MSEPVVYGPIADINGRARPLRGDDIDTDRIMPARFLRATSFDGLERHLFEDDRAGRSDHPFNDRRYQGAAVLIVNRNFGCGSSREHAPQGLARDGIRAIVGESFSEIFQGNAAAIGLPCVTAKPEAVDALQTLIERTPDQTVTVRLGEGVLSAGDMRVVIEMPAPLREAFLTGQWDPTNALLARFEEVRAVAGRLPYLHW